MNDVPRGAAIALCLLALSGLFVLGGAAWPASPHVEPSEAELDRDYAAHVGETTSIGGSVVETDPVVIRVSYDTGVYEEASFRLELVGDLEAAVGDDVYVSGELRPDRSMAVDGDRALVRQPWELGYMYAISFVGVLLVGARFLNGWRVQPRRLRVVPRERSLLQRWRGEADA
ncbi:hypothetical protein HWV07_07210 [Natronomonas salina]|uniref:hypothetical protein n=1 Tax=Natronomonas salina TaxID=1710540 RepID=UPI0015B765FE|nr:hypothetical protein [Natronomonas salina]QLD88829.1 hypothetical protein HWV07_07210 [Natronomonas salina]